MNRFAPALAAAALAQAVPAGAQDARDFQLPPAATPSPDTRVQGPVDTEGPVAVRPRAIRTDRPAPAPVPSASASPAVVLPTPAPARSAAPPRVATPAAAPGPAPIAGTAGDAGSPVLPAPAPPIAGPVSPPTAAAAPAPSVSASSSALEPAPDRTKFLPFMLGGVALALLTAGYALWRRRRAATPVPVIAVPEICPDPAAPPEALSIAVEAVRLDRSVMNATVGYRVTLRNRTARALTGVAVEADLVSASRERPAEAQLASAEQGLTPRHAADRLAPGQSMRFEGQVRLPLAEASAIWQGRIGLLVPLLRVRALAEGAAPVATTLVIGRAEGSSARPQPFRLDEPPRSYAPLAQRVVQAAA